MKYFNILNIKNKYNNFVLNESLFGSFLVLIATLLLSFRPILVKLSYLENIPVMDLFYYRFLITLPILLVFAFYKKRKELFIGIFNKTVLISCLFSGFFGYYIATLLDLYSLKLIDANINRIILYTYPIYVLILNSIIQKKIPKKMDIFFFLLVQLGLFFALDGFNIFYQSLIKIGVILSLLSAISYSIYLIINQQTGKKIGSILFTTYSLIFSFIFINIHFFVVLQSRSLYQLSHKGFIFILIMAIFCTFTPLLLITEGIKRLGASKFVLLSTIGPIFSFIFCFLILGERMKYYQIIGFVFVILSVYCATNFKDKSMIKTLT